MIGEIKISYAGKPHYELVTYDYDVIKENREGQMVAQIKYGDKIIEVDEEELKRNRDKLYKLKEEGRLIYDKKFYYDWKLEQYIKKTIKRYNGRDDLFKAFFPK